MLDFDFFQNKEKHHLHLTTKLHYLLEAQTTRIVTVLLTDDFNILFVLIPQVK